MSEQARPDEAQPQPQAVAQKSSATATLVLGVLSLLPGWGLVLGPIGWWLGNRELREIDRGLRWAGGRKNAKRGRFLAITGTVISVVVFAATQLLGWPPSSVQPDWVAENEITFVAPEGWRTMDLDGLGPPVLSYTVTPDRRSGNWIMLAYVPESVAQEMFGPREGRVARLIEDADLGPLQLVRGPDEIEITGVRGIITAFDGIVGERTGQPLSAENLWLFGDEASYMLVVQYEQDDRETMLAAWQQVMADLQVP